VTVGGAGAKYRAAILIRAFTLETTGNRRQ
jgi:hypothetical protein